MFKTTVLQPSLNLQIKIYLLIYARTAVFEQLELFTILFYGVQCATVTRQQTRCNEVGFWRDLLANLYRHIHCIAVELGSLSDIELPLTIWKTKRRKVEQAEKAS